MTLIFSWFFLGIVIPLMGLRASEQSDKRKLALFSGLQAFVGGCNFINFLSFTSVLATVMNWCSSDECQRMFASRNHSCLVTVSTETYEMSESYCEDSFYNVGSAFFFLLLTWVSCMGAMSARKMNEIRVVSVLSSQRQSCSVPMVPGYLEEVHQEVSEDLEVQQEVSEDVEVQSV